MPQALPRLSQNQTGRAAVKKAASRSGLKHESVRIRQLEEFVITVKAAAHDLNNVLAILGGLSELLLEDDPPETLAKRIEQIASAAQRAAVLTRSLHILSNRQASTRSPAGLRE